MDTFENVVGEKVMHFTNDSNENTLNKSDENF